MTYQLFHYGRGEGAQPTVQTLLILSYVPQYIGYVMFAIKLSMDRTCGLFHKSLYKRFSLYEFVKPVLNYKCNEFIALAYLCEIERHMRLTS